MAKSKRKRVMNEVDKRPVSTRDKEEWMIVNRGRNQRDSVSVGGKRIELYSSGATTYDKTLANEVEDKYKHDPDIGVINKSHVRLQGAHRTHFTVPQMPWKKDE